MTSPVKLYRNPKSGHCHRAELMMAFLGVPYETVELDMANGAHKAPAYLKISPLGQVPAIDDNGVTFTNFEISDDAPKRREMIQRSGGGTTVPQIFIGDVHVGGYTDLAALNASGGLDALLRNARAA